MAYTALPLISKIRTNPPLFWKRARDCSLDPSAPRVPSLQKKRGQTPVYQLLYDLSMFMPQLSSTLCVHCKHFTLFCVRLISANFYFVSRWFAAHRRQVLLSSSSFPYFVIIVIIVRKLRCFTTIPRALVYTTFIWRIFVACRQSKLRRRSTPLMLNWGIVFFKYQKLSEIPSLSFGILTLTRTSLVLLRRLIWWWQK